MKRKNNKKSLNELRTLVENLSDRDVKAKRDIRLFEDFFENFPIPVTIWAVTKEGTVVSQRGNGLVCSQAKCLDSLFDGSSNKDICVNMHKEALQGKKSQKIIFHENKVYYTSIIPRRDESGEVSGVAGLAWDISPNYTMIKNLEDIQDTIDGLLKDGKNKSKNLKEIHKKAVEALDNSRLHSLLKNLLED